MTYTEICKYYNLKAPESDYDVSAVQHIVSACPWYKHTARELTEQYLGFDDLQQERIQRYLVRSHEYDALDISRIVERSKKE